MSEIMEICYYYTALHTHMQGIFVPESKKVGKFFG